jgi:hypothetical protein
VEGDASMNLPNEELRHLDRSLLSRKAWLQVSMSARIHTKGCASAMASVVSRRKRTERGSRKERYILGRTGGLRRAGRKGERGDGIEDIFSARKQEIRRTSLES